MKMSAINRPKKMIENIIVAVNTTFSPPRFLVLYILPPPPNAAPKPVPFCCKRMEAIKRIANVICSILSVMNEIILSEIRIVVKCCRYFVL